MARSSFSNPWNDPNQTASSSASGAGSQAEALLRAAEALNQAAATFLELTLNRQENTSAGSPLSLQITVTDSLGEAIGFHTTPLGPDPSLFS